MGYSVFWVYLFNFSFFFLFVFLGSGFGTKLSTQRVHTNLFYFVCRNSFYPLILLPMSFFQLSCIFLFFFAHFYLQIFLDSFETKEMTVPTKNLRYYHWFFFNNFSVFIFFFFFSIFSTPCKAIIQFSHWKKNEIVKMAFLGPLFLCILNKFRNLS